MKLMLISIAFILLVAFSRQEITIIENEYPIQPVPFTQVKVTDDFWADRILINHKVTIPIAIQKSRETNRIDNFKIAGGLMEGSFGSPFPFDDSDIYKIIEGAAYSLQMFPDKALERTVDSLIAFIGLAQEEDGYLYTNRTIMGENAHAWAGKNRWEKEDDLSHELYNLGHFYEAATAYYQATKKREILDIAIKSANLVDKTFGYGKIENWPGHQGIEIGLVKLFRETGDKRYLDLAKFFLDIRGRGIGTPKTYNQSHVPVTEQFEAVGHSVRGAYMWSGMADVAALTGDEKYMNAIQKIWEDVVYRKLYITGGIGAEGGHEGFGGAYELPNEKAYCETCAAIANVFWNHRMFLMTGEPKYIDVLERSLYNNVLAGVSLSGDHFFYPNPLESTGQHARSKWFGCACCPSNISRFIPSMPNYIYAHKGSSVYVNLFVASQADFETKGVKIHLEQVTEMPWKGAVSLKVSPEKPVKANLHIRIPGWAQNKPVPGNLYSFLNPTQEQTTFKLNGRTLTPKIESGYALIERKWKSGDELTIELPFEVMKTAAQHDVVFDRDRMALQRGPLVYCIEWPDVSDSIVSNTLFDRNGAFDVNFEPDLLNGIVTITAGAKGLKFAGADSEPIPYPKQAKAIPYYAWAYRGKGEMAVWLPYAKEAVKTSAFKENAPYKVK